MKNKNYSMKACLTLLFCIFMSCNLNAESNCPYNLKTEFKSNENTKLYELGGLDCEVVNLSQKNIKSIMLVFSLFDNEGFPVVQNTVFQIGGTIKSKMKKSFFINLDSILCETDLKVEYADFAYVSEIYFEDGSVWSDPLGIKFFLNKSY